MKSEWSNDVITLRPYVPTDVGVWYEGVRDSVHEVSRWLAWCHEGYTLEEAEAWIALTTEHWRQGTAYNFKIQDARNGTFLGGCGVNHINRTHLFANIHYWVRTGYFGQGISTNATRLVAEFAFTELGLNRLEIVVDVANKNSERVAQNVGALREGIARNRLLHRTIVTDALMYSLIPEDLNLKPTTTQ